MKFDKTVFSDPPARYRAKPFWALNGKLEKRHLKTQIEWMKKMGFGGAFLHARTGLVTEYLSDEWMELMDYAAELLRENGMEAYLYDEDRWPSGTCGGLVTETEEFRAKSMVYDIAGEDFEAPEHFLGLFAVERDEEGAARSYRKIASPKEVQAGETAVSFRYLTMLPDSFYNGYTYVDTMYRKATDRFLELTHERYKAALGEKFGREILGIFTDEPHRGSLLNGFSRKEKERLIEIPYTFALFEEFERRKGYDLQSRLPVLWFGKAGEPFCKEMYDLIEVEEELFLENFAVPYLEWCRKNKLIVTGHVLHEDNLAAQTTMCGSVMRYYEFMDYPGMDNLWEYTYTYNVPRLVASAARQLGKKEVLDELYAGTGWKMRLADYKRAGDWQSASGVTLRCPHLAWYTMKGEAKRDYPASLLHQASFRGEYHLVEDYFARMHYVLQCGKSMVSCAILNPIESTWGLTNERTYVNLFEGVSPEYREIEALYASLYKGLLFGGRELDYIDEGILASHGGVKKDRLLCGEAEYGTLILCGNLNLRSSTLSYLREFLAGGGNLIVAGGFPRYLDGTPHDFTEELAGARRCAARAEDVMPLLQEREPLPRATLPLITVRRETEDGYIVLFLNPPECGEGDAEIVLETALSPAELCLRDGTLRPVPYERKDGSIVIRKHFCEDEEFCLRFSEEELPCEKEGTWEEVPLPARFRYELGEPNYLVLETADYFIDGVYAGRDKVLEIDKKIRDRFRLERRNNEMVQPWFKRKYFPPEKKLCRVGLAFTFDAAVLPKDMRLVGEELAGAEVFLNGVEVTDTLLESKLDNCFQELRLPASALRVGQNCLKISFDFYESTDIEGAYLCGSFGVERGERDTVITLPERLRAGDLAEQGLPYFGGTVKLRIPLPEGRWRLSAKELYCAAAKCNGVPLAFPPYRAEFSVKSGQPLELELVLTRHNLFPVQAGEKRFLPQGLIGPWKLERKL